MFDIQEELKKLPARPGVYIMHDENDHIIYVGKAISKQLENVIQDREQILSDRDDRKYVKIAIDETGESMPQVVCPILCEGDAIGSVILLNKDSHGHMGETEQILARCAAGFMGRQMEQ